MQYSQGTNITLLCAEGKIFSSRSRQTKCSLIKVTVSPKMCFEEKNSHRRDQNLLLFFLKKGKKNHYKAYEATWMGGDLFWGTRPWCLIPWIKLKHCPNIDLTSNKNPHRSWEVVNHKKHSNFRNIMNILLRTMFN